MRLSIQNVVVLTGRRTSHSQLGKTVTDCAALSVQQNPSLKLPNHPEYLLTLPAPQTTHRASGEVAQLVRAHDS